MATIHREKGIDFRVYPRDHPPAHVHACVGRAYAKIELATGTELSRVVRIVGAMKTADVAKAVGIVEERSELMWEGWKRFNG